jgi:hypothetical protein
MDLFWGLRMSPPLPSPTGRCLHHLARSYRDPIEIESRKMPATAFDQIGMEVWNGQDSVWPWESKTKITGASKLFSNFSIIYF